LPPRLRRTSSACASKPAGAHSSSRSTATGRRAAPIVDRLYAGYGEGAGGGMRGGKQGKILAGGNVHLDAEFPKLDRILRVRILEEPIR
jgi:hypothetical protein